ncbi:aldolase/citrate lyase family protein [Gammaproteobacteria bacterium]|jgi:2-keto-3-deoxy-L-rhamnonate aldolase RhmA|nr:aldolase/citrate lyase family protein [Gammaproteobacteria bacterium]|tara:strand:- start:291 stop:1016 length:726 start_codon:yes stop_codon:yes gene_type:complete
MSNHSIGTWLSLPNESVAEIFAKAGYDWVVIDLEHSSININQAEQLIRVIDLAGSKPFVRLSGHSSSQIKRVLDAGAKGILAPMVETKAQIDSIISACHYPPRGNRGMGLARAQGYGEANAKSEYILTNSKNIEIYAQIESVAGIANLDSILSQEIDGYFIGPYDLSASLGNPGVFDSDAFINAEEEILRASKQHQVKAGYHLVEPNPEQIPLLVNKGYDMIAFSVDIRMLDLSARLPFSI